LIDLAPQILQFVAHCIHPPLMEKHIPSAKKYTSFDGGLEGDIISESSWSARKTEPDKRGRLTQGSGGIVVGVE
jgi:hypothetical protein